VLGAQPVRPIDLAAFFATIANEGARPAPYAIQSIEQNGSEVYRHQTSINSAQSADPASFYQLKTMLQGVVQRGTAHAISDLAPYVAGKTGTSEDENDAWFVGFTNDVTVAVWVGYDNGGGKRRTLGSGATGAHVALPIFESVIKATWQQGRPKNPLNPPSLEAERVLVAAEGERARHGRSRSRVVLLEYLRKDSRGEPVDARYALLSLKGEAHTARAHSRSFERSVSRRGDRGEGTEGRAAEGRARNANGETGRGVFGARAMAPGQPAAVQGSTRALPPQWRDISPRWGAAPAPFSGARSNGGFFGWPFGR
jgi:membrane peptidoglycan carboxypeptidase